VSVGFLRYYGSLEDKPPPGSSEKYHHAIFLQDNFFESPSTDLVSMIL
jgi:hypothetical protein